MAVKLGKVQNTRYSETACTPRYKEAKVSSFFRTLAKRTRLVNKNLIPTEKKKQHEADDKQCKMKKKNRIAATH